MLTALMPAAFATEQARAGPYVMRSCNVPGRPNAPMYPWRAVNDPVPGISMVDACATGGGVGFSVDESRQISAGRNLTIAIDKPSGPRRQITFVRLVLWYAARLAGSGQPLNFFSGSTLSDGSFAAGISNAPPGSENLMAEQVLNADTRTFEVGVHCGALNGTQAPDPCIPAARVPLLIRGMELTLSEDIPPTVLSLGGDLVDSGPQSGARTLTYSASDPESGLAKVEALLDDTVVGSRDLEPRCFHSDFTVCPASLDESLEVDTRAVTNGPHRLTVRVQDAAGNERVVDHGVVEVENQPGAKPQDNFSTISAYAIVADFKGSSRSSLSVPYGRRVSVRGRMTRDSQPVAAGTQIQVLERLDRRGAHERLTRAVATKAGGSFSMGLATSRPSRVVRLAYSPPGGGQVVSRALRLRVGAGSRVRASLRGRVVRFSGRVLSGPVPKGGKRVQMEGRSPGSAWTMFESLRTDEKGGFSGTYRLRVRRPGVVLKIRAIVPSEAGYGYLGARSRAVSLRVR
jgi:hypothetical protein